MRSKTGLARIRRSRFGQLPNAASRADTDKVLAFLEKEPDLFARAQIGDKGAVNVEMRRTCDCCQTLVAGYHDERESFLRMGKFGRANPICRNRFRGRTRYRRRAAGDNQNCDTNGPIESHGARLSIAV